jgi:alkylhydroperoxidase family enzyme
MATNYERAFEPHPAVYSAWQQLIGAVGSSMPQRRYELATLAAALALRSSYCSLAHGRMIAEQLDLPVADIVRDRTTAGLSEEDVAVMDLAEQVAHDATGVTAEHRERLLELGLSDDEIDRVVLAAAARAFFSKSLDGLGALPDPECTQLDPVLRDALTVGRPIAAGDEVRRRPSS